MCSIKVAFGTGSTLSSSVRIVNGKFELIHMTKLNHIYQGNVYSITFSFTNLIESSYSLFFAFNSNSLFHISFYFASNSFIFRLCSCSNYLIFLWYLSIIFISSYVNCFILSSTYLFFLSRLFNISFYRFFISVSRP